MMTYKKKLIEVAIPLEAINTASGREKSIRHGHPSTLHLWWARRPLAACRAVLFAQLVDDPSSNPELFPTEAAIEAERQRLFSIIEDLVIWENSNNDAVLERARAEIRKSCGGTLPPIYDPFSGGCSIPLEAQRLGLPAHGSDLNPVAVAIGKASIEIPPKFKSDTPRHPGVLDRNHYRNAEGMAEDVAYYGRWMRDRAVKKIGHLYPQVDLPQEYGSGKATVVAWIWSRTVASPDCIELFTQLEVRQRDLDRAYSRQGVEGDHLPNPKGRDQG
jgi:putative DNA methylase